MSLATAEKKRWTVAEYLERERTSTEKHEYFDGEIFAMAGASEAHDDIAGDVVVALKLACRGKCRVFTSDMRLHVPATGLYTYADAGLTCGAREYTADQPPALKNPELIVEVLSDSTESYDRGKKFENYMSIPALRDYVLVAQDRVLVEHFTRQAGGKWLLEVLRAGQVLSLPCGEVKVDDFYVQQALSRPAAGEATEGGYASPASSAPEKK